MKAVDCPCKSHARQGYACVLACHEQAKQRLAMQVTGRALLPAASMLQMTFAAAAMLAPSDVKSADPLLTAVSLPSALRLALGSHCPEAASAVHLVIDPVRGETHTLSSSTGAVQAPRSVEDSPGCHLVASIHRVRRASHKLQAALTVHKGWLLRIAAVMISEQSGSNAASTPSWAVVSALDGGDELGAPLDSGLHLGAMTRRQSDGPSAAVRVPVGATAYASSSAQPAFACSCAANGVSQRPSVAVHTDHRLHSKAGGAGSSVQGLQTKALSPSTAAPPYAATNSALEATADPDCLYEVIHCASAPAAARKPAISAAGASVFSARQSTDLLLRGVAASLAVAQGAHGTATHVALRTVGAVRDSSDAPHTSQSPTSAALGSAMWSLARTQQAETASALQCSGHDWPAAYCETAEAVALLLGPTHGTRGGRLQGGGLDERSSLHAGALRPQVLGYTQIRHPRHAPSKV